MKVGDIVMYADANELSIPAYRNMRGRVVKVRPIDDWVLVQWGKTTWDTDRYFRDPATVKVVEENE